MSLDEIKNCNSKVIGIKQVKKAVTKGNVKKVYIASDAEPHIIKSLVEICENHKVNYEMAEKMELLGDACGIDVGSATVALLFD